MTGKLDLTGKERLKLFKKGDAVAHVSVGDGVVTKNDGDAVHVIFNRLSKGGKQTIGIYDAHWFGINPGYLFHRNTTEAGREALKESGHG